MHRLIPRDPLLITAVVSLALVLGGVGWSYVALKGISQPLILHFTNIVGITQIGSLYDLLGIAFLGLIMVLLNMRIAAALRARGEHLWAVIMAGTTLFLSLLIFLGFAAIISVN